MVRRVPLSRRKPETFGHFDLPVFARWMDDGRCMALLQPFTFHQTLEDGTVRTWTAPTRSITDGATIPQAFWSVIGGPYEGCYREAAVLHDYECCVQNPDHHWRDVHRMFYAGMRVRRVEAWKAALMYFAVYWFGPRWPASEQIAPPRFTEGDVARAARYLQDRPNVTLDDIEKIDPQALRRAVRSVPRDMQQSASLSDARRIRPTPPRGRCLDSATPPP